MSSIDTVSIFSSTTAADSIDKKKRKPLRHIRYQSKRPRTKSGRLLPGRGLKDPTQTATVCNRAVSRALYEDNSLALETPFPLTLSHLIVLAFVNLTLITKTD